MGLHEQIERVNRVARAIAKVEGWKAPEGYSFVDGQENPRVRELVAKAEAAIDAMEGG